MPIVTKVIGQHVKEVLPITVESLFLFSGKGFASIHLHGVTVAQLDAVNSSFVTLVPGDYTVHMPSGTCTDAQVIVTPVFQDSSNDYIPFHPTQYRPNGTVPYAWGWVTARRTATTDIIITLTNLAGVTLDQTTNPIVSSGHWDV